MSYRDNKFVFTIPQASRVADYETRSYLNELIRSLTDFQNYLNLDGDVYRQDTFVQVSSAYVLKAYDGVVLVDASTSSVLVTLPTAVSVSGQFIDIKKVDTNAATVVSIEGSSEEAPIVLNGSGRPSVTLFSTGSTFWII